MRVAVCVDPGYDDTGLAAFRLDDRVLNTGNDVLEALVLSKTVRASKAGDEPSQRLGALHRDMAGFYRLVANHLGISHVEYRTLVETPSYYGDYKKGRNNRRSVNKLYMAIGVCLAVGTLHGKCRGVQALTARKSERHAILEALGRTSGIQLPQGPRGGKREDEWDAIMIGIAQFG